jgi:FtsP/CotA-like multicopper oxidase with cupredoxin domain
VRIEFINDTMMHHPMHLHGHFFRVVTAAGAHSPVKHTVDAACATACPMVHASVTADDELDVRVELEKSLQITARGALFGAVEYDTNTYGDWSTGVTWTLLKELGLIAQYDSDHGFGAGVTISL